MALAFNIVLRWPPMKGIRQRVVRITADAAYPAGGWAVTAANCQLSSITHLAAEPVGGYVFEWDDVAVKLKAYWGDNNNASDGPLIEIPTNDAGVANKIISCIVIGR